MAILLDTGIVYAYYDASDRWHRASAALLAREAGGLLIPGPVVPEVDHLLGARLGREARWTFYRGLVEAAYLVIDLPQEAVAGLEEVDRRFADLELGFVDCAVAVLAETRGIRRIATADRRHFEPLARAFGWELLPAPP
ncbi:MAG: PIN domain-containing protein [Acidobacteriota bacterium]|nr:PIN domain-containing protein [Acidobacteriota bacterium]MDH3525192.1 PIN domain-containing protein [Acidobacteriota bacterium]